MKREYIAAIALCSLLISSFAFLGCEVGSSDSAVRNLDFNVTGIYRNTDTNANNGKLVSNNSGDPITQLDLRQTGDQLEANDNNGKSFRGTIGDEGDFTMTGLTTAGQEGTMVGTIEASSGVGTMRGTWAEPTMYGTIYGQATVASNSSSGGSTYTLSVSANGSGSVSPSGSGSYASGSSVTVTATPNSGHSFSNWTGSVTSTANPLTVTMDSDKTIVANFN